MKIQCLHILRERIPITQLREEGMFLILTHSCMENLFHCNYVMDLGARGVRILI